MRGELCGVSHKTDFERRRRALATVTGYQDRFVLCDTFWIDETHINDTDPSKGVFRQEDLSKKSIGN